MTIVAPRPSHTARVATGLAALALTAACTGSGEGEPIATPSAEAISYELALERIPLDGVPDRPLYWEVPELADPEQAEAVEVAVHFEALDHMLLHAATPRRTEDLDLLYLFATEPLAGRTRSTHARAAGSNPDPGVGPQWIRLIDASVAGDQATVMFCNDWGFYARVSEGGGREMSREHRWLLMEYQLVREPANGAGSRWLVDHIRWYAGSDYTADTGFDRECEQWATHELEDAP